MAERLLHVIAVDAWAGVQEDGALPCPASGFIHLCTQAQLPFVLARHFAGQRDLLALHLDPEDLDIRWEESEPGMDPFPHLYEALPVGAVRRADWL